MSLVIGDDQLILSIIADLLSKQTPMSKTHVVAHLEQIGFDRARVSLLVDKISEFNELRISDIDRIYNSNGEVRPKIVVTYPAYDNRGIPDKIGNNRIIGDIKKTLVSNIRLAKKRILIVSPYLESDGLLFFADILKMKADKGVKIKILIREYKENPNRMNKIARLYQEKLDSDNIRFYNYHFISEDGTIESTAHAKIIVVDNTIAYVGSADVRGRAFKLNFEMGSILTGYQALCVSRICDSMVDVSEEIELRK